MISNFKMLDCTAMKLMKNATCLKLSYYAVS